MKLRTLMVASCAIAALTVACTKHDDQQTQTVADNSMQTPNAGPAANVASGVDKAQDTMAGVAGGAMATMPTTTQGFIDAAAMGDMYEIKAAKIAEQRSKNKDVLRFAKRMVKEHGVTTAAIKGFLAAHSEFKAPSDLDPRRTGMLDNLKSAQDGDFDHTYLDQQVAAHQEMLTLMNGFSQNGDNATLKAFAAKTAPVVQMHLDAVQALK